MNPTRLSLSRLVPVAGLAAAALALSACGGGDSTTEPAAPVTVTVAPSTVTPTSSEPSAASTTATTSAPSATPSDKTTTVPENEVELDVDDQSGNGSRVEVSEVRVRGTAFVAIYGSGDQVLGSARVGNGRTLSIDLEDKITQTGEYRAVLFVDDGDGKFEADDDLRVIEQDDDGDDDDDPDYVDDDFDYTVR